MRWVQYAAPGSAMQRESASALKKKIQRSLKALGGRFLPDSIEVAGRSYTLRKVFKNDFFAVTSLYEGETGRVLLKVHRQASFLLIPLGWVGRVLAGKECSAFERLCDVDGVPRLIERWGRTGLVREFIEGHPLRKGERVGDDFHENLRALLAAIHAQDMAYVDLEKCENVLVGDDGRPHVFDFQIAWYLPKRLGGELWPARRLRRWFQNGDLYHLVKLQRRTRPDQLSSEALAASYRRPWYVRVHRFITWPMLWCRRRLLGWIEPGPRHGERGRVRDETAV